MPYIQEAFSTREHDQIVRISREDQASPESSLVIPHELALIGFTRPQESDESTVTFPGSTLISPSTSEVHRFANEHRIEVTDTTTPHHMESYATREDLKHRGAAVLHRIIQAHYYNTAGLQCQVQIGTKHQDEIDTINAIMEIFRQGPQYAQEIANQPVEPGNTSYL